jgi:hypothetical protein
MQTREKEGGWLMATCTGVVAVAAGVESIFPAQTSGIEGRKCGAGSFGTHTVRPCQPQPLSLWYTTSTTTTRAMRASTNALLYD